MSLIDLHLSCLAFLGLAFFVAFLISAYRFGLEIKRDRAESSAFYARMRQERFDSMTPAEQDACQDWR